MSQGIRKLYFCDCNINVPEIVETNHLRARAYELRDIVPCWYNRGIPPKAYTHRAAVGDEIRHTVGTLMNLPVEIPIYLDGSGGKQSKDPRNRTCGWAWICTAGDESTEIGEWGSLEGVQTVPRAEARALLVCISTLAAIG